MNNQEELKIQTTITDIESKLDKNSNRFYKVSTAWEIGKPNLFYAFSTDFNLKNETLQLLTNSPERLINQQASIIYQEQSNKDNQGSFFKLKSIEV